MFRTFIFMAGGLLLVTAVAKVISGLGQARVLASSEPITGFPFRWVLLVVGGIELGIALVCFCSKNLPLQTALIAWLGTSFVVYRLGLLMVGYTGPCYCAGHLTDALQLSPQLVDRLMKGMLAFLLIGSYSCALWLWHQRRLLRVPASANDK